MSIDPSTPDWVRDAVFYQIFPDRFARSLSVAKPSGLEPWGSNPTPHGYQGGDLVGVVEKLDYLGDLGVNALYLNPIFQSASNHRYHTHDYEKVDPMLGGNPALRRLLDEAHSRGIRVMLDGVFNHASRGFFQFHDILENGKDSAYLDWFHVHGFPLYAYQPDKQLGYGAWWNLPALPKFNTNTPAVREFLLGIATHWIQFGIDGWRLDVPNEIDDDDFWREFRRRVRRANPETYIVGEVWTEAKRWLKGDMWDAVMNYQFTRACIAFFIADHLDEVLLKKTSLHPAGATGAEAFAARINELETLYHPNVASVQFNQLDSHDMSRFLTLARGDLSALKLATLFQMTYTGAPSIYYGDEIGMTGGHDPENRKAFPWNDPESWNRELLHDFQRLISLRKSHVSLRRGAYVPLLAKGNIHIHARRSNEEAAIIALNVGKSNQTVDLPVGRDLAVEGSLFEDAWSKQAFSVEAGLISGMQLAPREGRVLFAHRPVSEKVSTPNWRLPEGVDRPLWVYAHSHALAEDEERYFEGHPLLEADQRVLFERFRTPGRLIDLGCGAGRSSLAFANSGFQVVSVDLSQPMLRRLFSRASEAGLGVQPVRANLCRLNCFKTESFDYAISMFSTLGMIRGKTFRRDALCEAFRILRSKGQLALHAHNLWLNLRDPQGRAWLLSHAFQSLASPSKAGDRSMTYRGVPGMHVHLFQWRN